MIKMKESIFFLYTILATQQISFTFQLRIYCKVSLSQICIHNIVYVSEILMNYGSNLIVLWLPYQYYYTIAIYRQNLS